MKKILAPQRKDAHKGEEQVFSYGYVDIETSKVRCQVSSCNSGLETMISSIASSSLGTTGSPITYTVPFIELTVNKNLLKERITLLYYILFSERPYILHNIPLTWNGLPSVFLPNYNIKFYSTCIEECSLLTLKLTLHESLMIPPTGCDCLYFETP